MAAAAAGLQSTRAAFCTPTLNSSVHVSTRSRPCNLAPKVVQFASSPFSKSAPLQSSSLSPSIVQLSKSIKTETVKFSKNPTVVHAYASGHGTPSGLLIDLRELSSMDTVVVFDFDLTIIDCDSDPWVMEQLGATELFESLLPTLPWNTVMDKMMGKLHEQGKTISDIEASLRTIPLYPETIRAIKFAFSLGCDLRIVSDANLFFIKTILETHDLLQYFTEIKANPAFVEESGRLRICPFHPFTVAPHGCNLCPPNMCKGAVIDEMRKSIEDGFNKRFIYLGDGSGDFCPTLKLTEGDDAMARKEYPLWKLIEKNPTMVKAQVHGWSNAKDVEDLLMKLLKP